MLKTQTFMFMSGVCYVFKLVLRSVYFLLLLFSFLPSFFQRLFWPCKLLRHARRHRNAAVFFLHGCQWPLQVLWFRLFFVTITSLHSFEHEVIVFVFSILFWQLPLSFSKKCVPSDKTHCSCTVCQIKTSLVCPFPPSSSSLYLFKCLFNFF